jgi:hypothetical protein
MRLPYYDVMRSYISWLHALRHMGGWWHRTTGRIVDTIRPVSRRSHRTRRMASWMRLRPYNMQSLARPPPCLFNT